MFFLLNNTVTIMNSHMSLPGPKSDLIFFTLMCQVHLKPCCAQLAIG